MEIAFSYLQGVREGFSFFFFTIHITMEIAYSYLQGVREGLRQSKAAPWQVSFAFYFNLCFRHLDKTSFRHLDNISFRHLDNSFRHLDNICFRDLEIYVLDI